MQSFRSIGKLGGAAVGALFLALFAGYRPALADEPGVARLAVVNGDVAIRRGDSNGTFAAAINAPLMTSDYLSTGSASRAEVQFDYGDFLRLGSNVQLRISQLDPSGHVVQLAAGTVEVSELHNVGAHPEIDTPSVAVRPNVAGQYRITVNPDASTIVTVRSGSVALVGTSASQTLTTGQSIAVNGAPANPQFHWVQVLAYDDFDAWNQSRDAFDGNDGGYQYANNQIVGIPDLSAYGSWADSSQYGWGWTPNNAGPSWSPYSDGQWVWEPYYGYTWVGNESWGWAPYHYGTWLYDNSAWTWFPSAGPQYPAGPYPYAGTGYYGYNASQSYGYPNGGYSSGYGAGYPYAYGAGYPPYSSGYPYNYGYPYPGGNTSSLLWAPALVTFLGLLGGENLNSALTTGLYAGNLAWTPLGPGEMAYPWYGPQQAAWYGYPSYGYPNYQTYAYGAAMQPSVINSYTTYNITKIVKIYRNVRAPHGVMVVSTKAFQAGQFRTIRAESLAQAHLTNVAVFRNVVPVAPTTANLRFTQAGPTRIAAIAPKLALFHRFPAPKQQPTQFAAVRSHVVTTAQKLYARHPVMPPTIARRVLTAAKPPASVMRKPVAPVVRRPVTANVRKPNTANVRQPVTANVRKPVTTNARKPVTTTLRKTESPAWQRFNQFRGPSPALKASAVHAAPKPVNQEHVAPEQQPRPYSAPQEAPHSAPAERPYSAPADRPYSAPVEHPQHSAPAERPYSTPVERPYSAPAQRQYQAPAQHQYQAPAQRQYHPPAQHQQQSAAHQQSQPHPGASNHGNDSNQKNNHSK